MTLRTIDQLASKLIRGKDKDIPVIAFEVGEHEQAAQFWIADGQSRFLINFPDHTFLRRLSHLEFSAQSVSFPFVDIVDFVVAMFQI